ncbi:hypothetical protein SGPA1_12569 [Streptomyces misionensis JCM 4497]
MDGERVHAHLRLPADVRRRARRPVRAQAAVHRRAHRLHRRVRRRGDGARHRLADCRPRGAGRGRGGDDAAHADPADRGGAGGQARHDVRHLGRGQRPRGRLRPADRRQPHRARVLALDLLAERSARPARPAAGASAAGRVPRHRRPPRRPRHPARRQRPLRDRVQPGQGPLRRLDGPGRADRAVGRRRAPARLRGLELAGREPHAADAPVPLPGLLRDQRGEPADVRRHVRLDLPAQPVHAERAGLLAHGRRAQDAAVDRDADARRPDRRVPVRPRGRPSGRRRGPVSPGGRPRLPGLRGHRARLLRRAAARPRPQRSRHGPVLRPGRRPGDVQRAPAGTGHRLRREQRPARGGRRARHRGDVLDLLGVRRLHLRPVLRRRSAPGPDHRRVRGRPRRAGRPGHTGPRRRPPPGTGGTGRTGPGGHGGLTPARHPGTPRSPQRSARASTGSSPCPDSVAPAGRSRVVQEHVPYAPAG